MSRAEALAVALVSAVATAVLLPYVLDAIGLGVMPRATALAAPIAAASVLFVLRASTPAPADTALFVCAVLITAAMAGWVAWPELLPPGSGPDLTHHLALVDYIEQRGTLVRDPNAAAAIGEMAQYTPGAHLLAVAAGAIAGTSGFAAMYSVVAFSAALKIGVFALCLLRMFATQRSRLMLASGGIAAAFHAFPYTFGAFVHDSFLAQVVSELFAISMWWAVIAWHARPARALMATFAACGAACFLTWPIFVGPPVVALCLVALAARGTTASERLRDLAIAFGPIAAVAIVHIMGRSPALGLAGTSGAVDLPSIGPLGWWLPAMAVIGLALSLRPPAVLPLLAFAAAIAAQAAALWLVARRSGASTPYMAIKMTYLAIFPVIAAAMLAVGRLLQTRSWIALAVAVLAAGAGRNLAATPRPTPVVSRDLFAAGTWARDHVPPSCVDYLVANEYTAYWLHLAVLRNPRADARSTDHTTYSTEASFARWITGEGPPHAIAKLSLLPAEIRDRVSIVYRSGDAAVIARDNAACK